MTTEAVPTAAEKPAENKNITGKILLGSLAGSGAGLVFGVIELLQHEPKEGFALLAKWGPGFVIALALIWAAHDVVIMLIKRLDYFQDPILRIATGMEVMGLGIKNISIEQARQADAQQRESEKDDRNMDRLITLVNYGNSQQDKVLAKMDSQSAELIELRAVLKKAG